MDLAVHAFPDFFPGQVQHILLAQRARFSSRQLEPPVGVRTEQLRIFVDHLRFHPDPKLHTHLIDRVCQFLQPALQLSFIDKPVNQGGRVIITVSEPASFAAFANPIRTSVSKFIIVASQLLTRTGLSCVSQRFSMR